MMRAGLIALAFAEQIEMMHLFPFYSEGAGAP